MGEFETIIYEKNGSIGCITLNRPRALNAYNIRMRDELYEVLGAIRDDSEVRVVLLKGAGEKAFCAGADLTEFLSAPPPVFARTARFERDIWGRFAGLPQPLIAAMQGYVLGSGIEMSLYCDIRLCSEDAQFGLPEVTLGIIPAAGGSQTLPRQIGTSRALDILLTGRWIKAEEARRFRLVNRVLARSELYPEAERIARRIAGFEPLAVTLAKAAVKRGLEMTLNDGLQMERRLAGSF
ncbi:MAG TPA: enoyl-CoA hydratase-related protein [Dehalococcoidales bacterium]|nr:enoyl-CoA hydratase-related protein [Dehalococcoidales bacterium]